MKLTTLPIDAILPPVVPMRAELDEAAFAELVADVRRRGLLQPIVVRPEGAQFRVIAGARRWRACQEAGLLEVPATVREVSDEQMVEEMIVENLHRDAVPPLDEGRTFAIWLEGTGGAVEDLARKISKSPSYVSSRLALLGMPADVQDALRRGRVSLSVARELARCAHDGDRAFYLHHALDGNATTDLVRRWVSEANFRRHEAPDGSTPAAPGPLVASPPVLMASCDWHRGQVPLDRTLRFTVCGDCYTLLLNIREEAERLERTRGGGDPHAHGE